LSRRRSGKPGHVQTQALLASSWQESVHVSVRYGAGDTGVPFREIAEQVPKGYTVTLTAQPSGTDAFTGWSGGGCSGTGPSCTVLMSQAQSVTASFENRHVLSFEILFPTVLGIHDTAQLTISPGGFSQHINAEQYSNALAFSDGTAVTISLFPDQPGASITWAGACAGTAGNTCTITMNSDQSFGAAVS
jgi:hypothetical protein